MRCLISFNLGEGERRGGEHGKMDVRGEKGGRNVGGGIVDMIVLRGVISPLGSHVHLPLLPPRSLNTVISTAECSSDSCR